MTYFFRQAGGDLFEGSPAYLDSLKSHFSADQATGLIEIQLTPQENFFLLFAGGTFVGAYRRGAEACLTVHEREVASNWGAENLPIRLLTLSDVTGRAVWLALEAQPRRTFQVQNAEGWESVLAECRREQFTGQVRAVAETCEGLFLFWRGALVPSEAVFWGSNGFEFTATRFPFCISGLLEITFSELDPTRPAAQSCILRLAGGGWSKSLLERYRAMAGQRLLQTLTDDLNVLLSNWRWKIRLTGSDLLDRHFFPYAHLTSQAYYSIFESLGERMRTVFGDLLVGRMINESFETLEEQQKQVLADMNLTPEALIS